MMIYSKDEQFERLRSKSSKQVAEVRSDAEQDKLTKELLQKQVETDDCVGPSRV